MTNSHLMVYHKIYESSLKGKKQDFINLKFIIIEIRACGFPEMIKKTWFSDRGYISNIVYNNERK